MALSDTFIASSFTTVRDPHKCFRMYFKENARVGSLYATARQYDKDREARHRFYLPTSKQHELIKTKSLFDDLISLLYPQKNSSVIHKTVKDHYLKVFCTLLHIGRGNRIHEFTKKDTLSDRNFPFHSRPDHFPDFKTTGSDSDEWWSAFSEAQWMFSVSKIVPEWENHEASILPFYRVDPLGYGDSAAVYKIHFDTEYMDEDDNNKDPSSLLRPQYRELVLKTYHSNGKEDKTWKREKRAYRLFSEAADNPYPAVITSYYSYPHGPTKNTILEYVKDGTLDHLYAKFPTPQLGDLRAIYTSIGHLLWSLAVIHNIRSRNDPAYIGVHFDVKPRNIFLTNRKAGYWYQFEAKLGDFGTSFFAECTGDDDGRVPAQRGTRTYAAPELYPFDGQLTAAELPMINADSRVDVWSFGAVCLEFLTWVHLGQSGLEEFRAARVNENKEQQAIQDLDCFHNGSTLLKCVEQQFDLIDDRIRYKDLYSLRLLRLIQTKMLRFEETERARATSLRHEWNRIMEGKDSIDDLGRDVPSRIPTNQHRDRSFSPQTPIKSPAYSDMSPLSTSSQNLAASRSNSNSTPQRNTTKFQHTSNVRKARREDEGEIRNSFSSAGSRLSGFGHHDSDASAIANRLQRELDVRDVDDHVSVNYHPTTRNRAAHRIHDDDESTVRGAPPLRRPTSQFYPENPAGSDTKQVDPRASTVLLRESSTLQLRRPADLPDSVDSNILNDPRSGTTTPFPGAPSRYQSIRRTGEIPRWETADAHRWANLPRSGRDNPHIRTIEPEIRGRHMTILVDDSAAMAQYWYAVADAVKAITEVSLLYSKHGVNLRFAKDPLEKSNILSSGVAKRLVQDREPTPQSWESNLGGPLSKIFRAYYLALSELQGSTPSLGKKIKKIAGVKDDEQRTIFYILTDGRWQDEETVIEAIDRFANAVESLNMDSAQCGVQFIRFGSDPEGVLTLERTIERLASIRDLIDCEPWTGPGGGNFLKVLLGSICPRFHHAGTRISMTGT